MMEENANVYLRNRCRVDEQVMRRAFYVQRRSYNAVMLAILIADAAVLLLLTQFTLSQSAITVLILIPVLAFLLWYMPRLSAKMRMRQIKELRGVDVFEVQADCTDEGLVLHDSVSQDCVCLRYETLKKVCVDGGLIVVMSKAKQLTWLDRDRFENGTAEDFWRLLAQKAPQAKLPRQAKR